MDPKVVWMGDSIENALKAISPTPVELLTTRAEVIKYIWECGCPERQKHYHAVSQWAAQYPAPLSTKAPPAEDPTDPLTENTPRTNDEQDSARTPINERISISQRGGREGAKEALFSLIETFWIEKGARDAKRDLPTEKAKQDMLSDELGEVDEGEEETVAGIGAG